MNNGWTKYKPFEPVKIKNRTWPSKTISKPPIWCSVDLRDGNQALPEPMSIEDKIEYFKLLVSIGVKEIEVGFPSASDIEYHTVRKLIEENLIPDDVTIQVMVQCRIPLIERTFSAIEGAKNVIFHFYNTTSEIQRKAVFKSSEDGIVNLAENAAVFIKEMGDEFARKGTNIRYQYSPESFSDTDTDYAIRICQTVLETLQATPENPVILNLPATVECCMPNQFADQIEYFINNLPSRDCAIISVHPHNDRGTGVASAELALLAGAERIEGTLFGNGERTGNGDIITLAMNMFSQGIDPKLCITDICKIKKQYERFTKLSVHERHPYAGALAFTAFSGAHQDAINKGMHYLQDTNAKFWKVPYLPMDPSDIGRQFEPIIRINSQSGKGGAAFIMENIFGFKLPKAMHAEFGALIQRESEKTLGELPPQRIMELFQDEYINMHDPYALVKHSFSETFDTENHSHVQFCGTIRHKQTVFEVAGEGNGPIDAFFNAIHGQKMDKFTFVDYSEHAISNGSDSQAVAYIHLRTPSGNDVFGVGMSHNINLAPLRGIISAINRAQM